MTDKPPFIATPPHPTPQATPASAGAPVAASPAAKPGAPASASAADPKAAPPAPQKALQVQAGAAMYSGQSSQLPVLAPMQVAATGQGQNDRSSMIAEGVNFVGNAQLIGLCTVGGKIEGNLMQSAGSSITVIVTETGHVKGDIVADNISVMGQTDGLLDAGGGSVALHDASRVSGHVRYNRLQVNGADLNATLEKAATKRERTLAAPAIASAAAKLAH
jgi:cytoskeletal protein CcmA (bactofilin family)